MFPPKVITSKHDCIWSKWDSLKVWDANIGGWMLGTGSCGDGDCFKAHVETEAVLRLIRRVWGWGCGCMRRGEFSCLLPCAPHSHVAAVMSSQRGLAGFQWLHNCALKLAGCHVSPPLSVPLFSSAFITSAFNLFLLMHS